MRLLARPSKGWVLTGLFLVSIVLMLLGERARWLCRRARPVLVPLSHLGMTATVHLRTRAGQLVAAPQPALGGRADALRRELLSARETVRHLNRKIDELRAWRSQLKGFRCKLIDASVIGAEALPLRDRRLLGAGSRRGVAAGDLVTTRRLVHEFPKALPEGLAVLGRSCLVGRIVDSAAYSATLQMVTDPHSRLPGRILRQVGPGQHRAVYVRGPDGGLLRELRRHDGSTRQPQEVGGPIAVRADGDGQGIICRHVPAYHEVRPGDLLKTPRSAGLPFRLPIGRVRRTEPEKADPHFVTVYVRPLAGLAALRDVYVVLPVAGRQED